MGFRRLPTLIAIIAVELVVTVLASNHEREIKFKDKKYPELGIVLQRRFGPVQVT
jgi:hypothetical protein